MCIFDYKCFNCGAKKNLAIDHHLPLSKGNALTISNAVVLCRSCNSSKKDIIPEKFYSRIKLKVLNGKLNKAKKYLPKWV